MEPVSGQWEREVVEAEGTGWWETVILTGLVLEEEVEVQFKLVRAMMP